ncbi:hemolymph lipopolysaccharide-binding protein-like [Osmia bicornis bicornis]|uniref:hemolymph lipopolysaccharide-binding protein-like n=1 Tax=Osmia bicornis bicornis TaxID=1437191 RepID=UPI001EAF1DE7|nr:hemolymph lipopolysaccharide-binding protein-like [Osmia bicornis bicornis]
MSALSILVNCIILCAALRSTYSTPKKIAVLKINKTDNILIDDTSYSSVRNPLKSYWNDLPTSNVNIHGTVCMCNLGMRGVPPREDYIYTAGIGSHKLHTRAESWNNARKICNQEGGHLAIINSYAEQRVLMELFKRSGPVVGAIYKKQASLGLHDLYMEGDWVTILGDPLAVTGFTVWSNSGTGQPDNTGGVQHCAGMLRDGTMDDINCNIRHAFFCEIPELAPL